MMNGASGITDEELLLALGNTGHDEVDELADADGVVRWWAAVTSGGAATSTARGAWSAEVAPRGPDLLRALRGAVRDTATANTDGVTVPHGPGTTMEELAGVTLHPVTADGRLTLRARHGADLSEQVAATVVAALLRSQARPAWPRLKACAAPDCRWLFVDASRNRSRRWCDMAECGNRAKSAAFRRRRRT